VTAVIASVAKQSISSPEAWIASLQGLLAMTEANDPVER
jgi:hypothetical protein